MSGVDLRPIELNPNQEKTREDFHLGIDYSAFLVKYTAFITDRTDGLKVARALQKEGNQILEKLVKEKILTAKELREIADPLDNLARYINSHSQEQLSFGYDAECILGRGKI